MITDELAERAHRAGVATTYDDWSGTPVAVGADAVERILAVLESDSDDKGRPAGTQDGDRLRTSLTEVPRIPAADGGRLFGWQLQLYQLRSERSWGIGDYGDLAELARGLGAAGADVILVNPMHAMTPPPGAAGVQNSPYFPSSRRFSDQLGICVELLPEYVAADDELRARVDALRPAGSGLIDRDAVWAAKRAAFALLAPQGAGPGDDSGDEGADSGEFAVFCALAEEHGTDWRTWPQELQRPGDAARAAADAGATVLHRWVQTRAREQLRAAQSAARDAGMAVGLIHDLAVGVDPGGADAWENAAALAGGFTVGAPPDSYNQLGQDWGLPPWRPDRLAATGYAPFRAVVQAALALGGGLRVDHVMGLFRLWWVPAGQPASEGTYVSYDGRAMLDVITGQARQAGAVVIGEDLGTVAPEVTQALGEAGVLGSAVLWFETDEDDVPLPPEQWREAAAASVSTHDLPTAYGQLAGEPARVRHELGQLGHSLEVEQANAAKAQSALETLLRGQGFLDAADTDPDAVVLAMHRLVLASPSRIVLFAPADAVGDLRQPNLPGTTDEYPNWRMPLADRDGNEVDVAAFLSHPGTMRLTTLAQREIQGRANPDNRGRSAAPDVETPS